MQESRRVLCFDVFHRASSVPVFGRLPSAVDPMVERLGRAPAPGCGDWDEVDRLAVRQGDDAVGGGDELLAHALLVPVQHVARNVLAGRR